MVSFMVSLSELFSDFSRLKELSEEQVVELVTSFQQVNEKLAEDLPSGLEGYAEFLKDKGLGGSGSKVEKLIKSSISSDCKQIVESKAYKLVCAFIYSNQESTAATQKQLGFTTPDLEQISEEVELEPFNEETHDPLSFLRVVLMATLRTAQFRMGLRYFRLPWLSSTSFREDLPRSSSGNIIPSTIFGRILTLPKVKNPATYDSLYKSLSTNDKASRESKKEPKISFFGEDIKLRLLESLLKNEFSDDSQSALSLWITFKLSELVSPATGLARGDCQAN